MNVNPHRTTSIFFFFFSLFRVFFFSSSLPACNPIGRLYLSVLFSHLLRRLNKNENGDAFFSSSILFCKQLFAPKGRNISASSFFIYVIYMRALKDDARFDLFYRLIVCMHEKTKNLYRWQVKKTYTEEHRIISELNTSILSWGF